MKLLYRYGIVFTFGTIFLAHPTPIKLESEIIAQFDGTSIGINGDVIARIKKYQSKISDLLLGKKSASGRHGLYEFDGVFYTVQELRKKEESLTSKSPGQSSQLHECIRRMRDDFEAISKEFQVIAQGTKPIMSIFIEESCKKRNRTDSLLLIWSKTKEQDEYTLFDLHVKSIKDFEIFVTDLYNFLEDLAFSCPKATKQFNDRLEKYKHDRSEKVNKIKQVLGTSGVVLSESELTRFTNQYVDKMALQEISASKIKTLLEHFSRQSA